MANSIKFNSHTAVIGGKSLDEAQKALIMIHGRGGNATEIVSLADHLQVADYALLAPQAPDNSWYPFSFIST